MTDRLTIHQGDTLETLRRLPDESVQTCVTSPPYYGLRSYLPDDHPDKEKEIGAEATPQEYVAKLVTVFREVRRVLRDDGTVWLNLGDSYAGSGRGPSGVNGIGGQEKRQGFHSPKATIPDGLKPKDLIGIPWRVAFALQNDGCADLKAVQQIQRVREELLSAYKDAAIPDRVLTVLSNLENEYREAKGSSWYLRQDIIWNKTNPMPESVTDRCTKAHEYIFLLSKSPRYYYDHEAIKEPAKQSTLERNKHGFNSAFKGQFQGSPKEKRWQEGGLIEKPEFAKGGKANKRSVWTVTTKPYKEAHFATFPPDLIRPCILAGAPEGGVVIDPFGGSGTTAEVALQHNRRAILCELNPDYVKLIEKRLAPLLQQPSLFPMPTDGGSR